MTKYRIVQVAPIHHKNAYEVQRCKGSEWDSLIGRYNSFYEAQDYIKERSRIDRETDVLKQELEKWNATHGKYQVIKEYE